MSAGLLTFSCKDCIGTECPVDLVLLFWSSLLLAMLTSLHSGLGLVLNSHRSSLRLVWAVELCSFALM